MPTTSEEIRWVENLSDDCPEQARWIAKLRSVLLRGVSAALTGRGVDESFCEDIVQESLLLVLSKLEAFEGRSKFTTWAMTIAIRQGISGLRRRHFKDVSLSAVTDGGLTIEPADFRGGSVEEEKTKQGIIDRLRWLIENSLTDKQRMVMRALLEGMPVEEIAARTGSNRNAVYKLAHDSRKRIKEGFSAAQVTEQEIHSVFFS